jgi:hypothetical protein
MHGLADEFRRLNDEVELPPLDFARELAALEQRAMATLQPAEREAYGVRKLAALERVARGGRPARGFAPHTAPFLAERAVNQAEGAALALRVQRFLAGGADESTVQRLLGAVDLQWEIDSFDEERRVRGLAPDPPPRQPIDAERARLVARVAEDARRPGGTALADEVLRACRQRVEAMLLEREERSHYERTAAWRRTRDLLRDLRVGLGPALSPASRKELGRLLRRCAGMAQDARVEIRLERLLGTRGAALVGWLGIWLLLLLLVLLVVDLFVTVPAGWILPLVAADTVICTVLLCEFGLKLALAPERVRWFLRHALTDLLPALPVALLLLIAERQDGDVELDKVLVALELGSVMRALKLAGPFLRFLRFVLSALRWLDELVEKMAPVLNRDFVAFEPTAATTHAPTPELSVPGLLRRIARRQRLALEDSPGEERARFLSEEADRLAVFFRERIAVGPAAEVAARSAEFRLRSDPDQTDRSVEVERAIEVLWRLEAHEVEDHVGRRALLALARFLGGLGAPLIRHLPLIRPFAQAARRPDPEERVVAAARVAAARLERWHARALAFADLSGILTAPQLLDRIASAVMKATQRPAVRLLMFGTLAVVFQGLFNKVLGILMGLGAVVQRFVTTPLLVIGSVCLVILLTARWLKKIAGEASESLQRIADAQFLELVKLRKAGSADQDLLLLARRVFLPERAVRKGGVFPMEEAHLVQTLEELVRVRQGRGPRHGPDVMDEGLRRDLEHAALLYLHYLDGPTFHRGDVKISVQLLSNLNLERIRSERFVFDKAARKRLKKLDLEDGTMFSGPYLWFQFMAESVALEVARLLTEYNRCCLTRAERASATPAEAADFDDWLRRRAELEGGRKRRAGDPRRSRAQAADRLATTEFTALDFLAIDGERDHRIEQVFGPEVLAILRHDRRRLIREVFGTRPLHRLPRARRTFNPYVFYRNHLAGGRALLLPVWWLRLWGKGLVLLVRKVVQTTREILFPELARAPEIDSRGSFAVATRKINRMRKPLFMECLRMRARFDLAYAGLPVAADHVEGQSFLVQDLEFIGADERERAPLLAEVESARQELSSFHQWLRSEGGALLPPLPAPDAMAEERRRALCTAWVSDAWSIRTLACARVRLAEIVAQLHGAQGRVAVPPLRRAVLVLEAAWRTVRRRPMKAEAAFQAFRRDAFPGAELPFRLRRRLLAAFRTDHLGLRRLALAWHETLAEGGLEAGLRQRIARAWLHPEQITRELVALRTVQTLSVLDIQAYRRLVFELGGFAEDGGGGSENPAPHVTGA